MEDDRHHGAEGGEVSLAHAKEEDYFGHQEAGAQVGVDGGAVVLCAPEGGKDGYADDEADDADGAAEVGEDVEHALVLPTPGEAVHIDQHSKVSEVEALAGGAVRGRPLEHRVAALLGPRVQAEVPVDTLPVREARHVVVSQHKLQGLGQRNGAAVVRHADHVDAEDRA